MHGVKVVSINSSNDRHWMTANRNVLVCGAQDSRKSQGYVRVNILQAIRQGTSVFVTDPSGDIFRDLSKTLEMNGYIVKVLNTKELKASDAWDCFESAKLNDSIDVFADIIIKNTVGDEKKSDAYFENAATLLLQAICYYVISPEYASISHKRNGGTFEDIFNLIVSNSAADFEAIFNRLDEDHKAKKFFRLFEKAENVKGSTILGLGSRLKLWINEDVQAMTSNREIDLTLPGRQRCAYFCITSDQEQSRSLLAALFFSFLGIALANYADRQAEGILPVPVHFFLDEFCNLGCLPQFESRLATWRKRGIAVSVIVQSLSQLAARYPETWQEIINGCKYDLFMGCNDLFTSEYYEKLSGTSTVVNNSKRRSLNFFRLTNYTPTAQYTDAEGKRPTITADEFRTLDENKCILFIQGCHPLRLNKYYFYNDPRGIAINKNKAMKQNAEDHMPEWRREKPETIPDNADKIIASVIERYAVDFNKVQTATIRLIVQEVIKEMQQSNKEESEHEKVVDKRIKAVVAEEGSSPDSKTKPEKGPESEMAPLAEKGLQNVARKHEPTRKEDFLSMIGKDKK